MSESNYIRPIVRKLHPYVPGEQPKIKGLIKLNTNENPYPPSPKVLRAIKAAVDGRLRLYPPPTAQVLREKLARLHGCRAENIIIGNGSDELLAMAVRAFVEPSTTSLADRSLPGRLGAGAAQSRSRVQYFTPSYSLYPVLSDIHGAVKHPVPLHQDFGLPGVAELRGSRKPAADSTNVGRWDFRAALSFITTPNAPSGRGYETASLDALCKAQRGVVVLDEAYVDFAAENGLALALKHPHVLVARTFSKAYSLCFQRIGYFVGHTKLIAALDKIRDSYNVNGLGQVAALATLEDLDYYRKNFRKIISTRQWLTSELEKCGFEVLPSQTNFILARPPVFPAKEWLTELREHKILVRWFDHPKIRDYLRITIGAANEAAALVEATKAVLRGR